MKAFKLSGSMLAASLTTLLEALLLCCCFANPWPMRIFLWVMEWPKAAGSVGQFLAIAVLLALIIGVIVPPISLFSRTTREYLFGRGWH